MKQMKADKSLFGSTLGLSCVENYLLYIYILQGYDYRYLYSKSFISMSDIVSAFCDDSAQYAYFDKIPRLQDVAVEQGLLTHTVEKDFKASVNQYDYCCIGVSQRFVNEQYGRDLWRDDHFILLCEEKEDEWICLNDNPRDCLSIQKSNMPNIYGGQSVCFQILSDLDESVKDKLLHDFQEKIGQEQKLYEYKLTDLLVVRDILGILRVTSKRIRDYCSIYFDTLFMNDYLLEIDNLYVLIEYMRLRKREDFDKVHKSLEEIQRRDIEITTILYKRMEMIK